MFYGEATTALGSGAREARETRVRFSCRSCGSCHDVARAELVWLLKAFDLGDERTCVAAAAQLDDHACVRCGGTQWEAWTLTS